MSGERDVSGVGRSAQCRRERRLRSKLGHERQTVEMELAAALHHSCGVRPDVSYQAPRGHSTASSVGGRPGVLKEPEPPLVDAAFSYWVAGPSLSSPLLGAASDVSVDARSLYFLQAKEEEKKAGGEAEGVCGGDGEGAFGSPVLAWVDSGFLFVRQLEALP